MPGDERIFDFSQAPAYLSLEHERLIVKREDEPDIAIPLRDTAAVVLTHPQITCTKAAIAGIMRHGGALIVCDENSQPCGMMLPLVANSEQTKRMIAQVNATQPLRKRLWKQIVIAKILTQASVLELHTGSNAGLPTLAKEVRSGDPGSHEALAAQRYWPLIFKDPMFRRRRAASDQNRMLNYGYAVLRATVGRALCAAGLHPSIGVHHHGRTNPWCLADDLMEPYRPLIDDEVAEITASFGGDVALDGPIKARLAGVMHSRIEHENELRTVSDWIGRSASSMAHVFLGEQDRILFPEGLWR